MKYHQSILFVLSLSVSLSAARAEILNDWTFDDAAGTDLQTVTNAGPQNASFAGQTTGWETDGNGLFVASTATNYFRNADIVDITTGESWLRLEIDSWNFTGTTESEQLGFCFRTAANNNIALIKIIRVTDSQVRLQIDDGATTTIENYDAANFTNGLDIIAGVNVSSDSYAIYYRTGADDYALAQTGTVNAAYTLDLIRFQQQNNSSQAGEFWAVDRLTHAESFSDLAGPTIIASTTALYTNLFEVTFDSQAGLEYGLQSAPDLIAGGSWTDQGVTITGDGSPKKAYGLTGASGNNNYRVTVPTP